MCLEPPWAAVDRRCELSSTATGKRIAVSGAGGFMGSALSAALAGAGWSVSPLVRRSARAGEIRWDPDTGSIEGEKLEGIDAVVHLAGESIAGVWTPSRKRRIRDSRVNGTRLLADTIASLASPPRVLVSASAVGYYGDGGEHRLTESSPAGDDFLATVCVAWERSTEPAKEAGVRVVITRFGLLLHPSGGVLQIALPIFRLGLGGRFGRGQQWLSWVSRSDAVRSVLFVLESDELQGPVNVTSPAPVRNREFTRVLGKAVNRPALFAVPEFALRTFSGGMADALLLASQHVIPRTLMDHGFDFDQPDLATALAAGLD